MVLGVAEPEGFEDIVVMSVGIAWRLVLSGVASDEEVESALRKQLCGGQPFVRALVARSPEVARVLERELPEPDDSIEIDEELARRLPEGAAATLLAVPVGRDPGTGEVLVACLDPLDGHIQNELSFHIGETVKTVPARLEQLLAALPPLEAYADVPSSERPRARAAERVEPIARRAPPPRKGGTPAFGTPLLRAADARPADEPARVELRPSAPPIPLVRLSSHSPPPKPGRAGSGAPGAERSPGTDASAPAPAGRAGSVEGVLSPSQALEEIGTATTPDEIVTALVRGALPVAARVLAFGVRGATFVGREARGGVDAAAVRRIEVPLERPSILKTASELGHYLGPVPDTEVHRSLSRALGSPKSDVSVHAAQVAGRVALVLLLEGFDNAYVATGRGEQLCRAAGSALENLVRAQKR